MSPTDKVRCNIMPIARGYSRVSQPFFLRPHALALLRARRERPRNRRAANKRDDLATPHHVWMAPAWQEIIWRAAQRSLAVMCPACWCSPAGLLALMGCANRVLIIQTGSMSR